MRHVLGPGVMRHAAPDGTITDIPFEEVVIKTTERITETTEAIATLSVRTVEVGASLTAFGRMWLAGLLNDDWRRHWYRSPGGWWE